MHEEVPAPGYTRQPRQQHAPCAWHGTPRGGDQAEIHLQNGQVRTPLHDQEHVQGSHGPSRQRKKQKGHELLQVWTKLLSVQVTVPAPYTGNVLSLHERNASVKCIAANATFLFILFSDSQ